MVERQRIPEVPKKHKGPSLLLKLAVIGFLVPGGPGALAFLEVANSLPDEPDKGVELSKGPVDVETLNQTPTEASSRYMRDWRGIIIDRTMATIFVGGTGALAIKMSMSLATGNPKAAIFEGIGAGIAAVGAWKYINIIRNK